jgi:hypothetical protein
LLRIVDTETPASFPTSLMVRKERDRSGPRSVIAHQSQPSHHASASTSAAPMILWPQVTV